MLGGSAPPSAVVPRTRPTGARPFGALHCVQRLHCLTSLRSPPSGGRRQWSLAGEFPAAPPQMGTLARSRSASVNDASRKGLPLRLVLSSGSYLLSRDLASDYHRRADVSLPGSEWDRVGPSGCDHRIAGLRRGLRCCLARLLAVSWGPFVTWGSFGVVCLRFLSMLPCLGLGGGRLTSAWRVGVFPWFELFFKFARVCHHGGMEVYWMLVVLG